MSYFAAFHLGTYSSLFAKAPDYAFKPYCKGAQWLSSRVLYSGLRGCGSEPHRRHCVVVPEQDTFILA